MKEGVKKEENIKEKTKHRLRRGSGLGGVTRTLRDLIRLGK